MMLILELRIETKFKVCDPRCCFIDQISCRSISIINGLIMNTHTDTGNWWSTAPVRVRILPIQAFFFLLK